MADKKEAAAAENKEKEKKEKKSLPLMSILTIVLVVVTLFISVFSLIKVIGTTSAIEEFVKNSDKPKEIGDVPLSEIETLKFKDDFIVIYEDSEDKSTYNVIVKISIGVRNNDDTAEEYEMISKTFTDKEDIIRNGVQDLLSHKSHEVFQDPEKKNDLEDELVEHFQSRFGSNAVIEVYCNDILISHKK